MVLPSKRLREFVTQQLALYGGQPVDIVLPDNLLEIWMGLAEANLVATDQRGNKDFQHNPLFWSGNILEPIINQWVAMNLATQVEGDPGGPSIWPEGKKFAVCLTHDVDWVKLKALPGQIRYLKNRLRNSPIGKTWLKTSVTGLANLAAGVAEELLRPDKTDFLSPWLTLEESYGFRSTFFFFPDRASRYHTYDGPWYEYRDRVIFEGQCINVSDLIGDLVSRGWEVGLHGTFHSFDDSDELRRQKDQIEQVLGQTIFSVRQHCLHFDTIMTPRAQRKAGFKYDSTMGFNRMVGFRNGMAFPFYPFDLKKDEPLPILQIPLHIQDGALLRPDNLGLTPELALKHAKNLIDKVEQYNGMVTLLWHPHVFIDHLYPRWFWLYQELIKYIAAKEAWVAPIREIGTWWESHQKKLGVDLWKCP
jgi:hypothetical protein